MSFLKSLDGYKTYVAAAGFAGLALYQFTQGDATAGFQSLLAALGAVGLRHAVSKAATSAA
jgi:hypothetical protein